MFLIDTHCHLDYEPLTSDIKGTLERAQEQNIKILVTIGTELSKTDKLKAMAEQYPNIYWTMGVHPHEANKTLSPEKLEIFLKETARHPKLVGLGETGLDYYYEHSSVETQKEAFRAHIKAALTCDLPLIVHTRNAEEDTIELLKEEGGGKARGVIHCFSGSAWLRDQALALGFYISVAGIATFKKAEDFRQVLRDVPLDRLLLETDSPYLAPEPYRGKPNEPAYMIQTAKKLAELKNVSLEEIAEETTRNALTLFRKVKPCA